MINGVFNEESNNGYEDYQNDLNTSLFNDDEIERGSRTARLLNVFSIVRNSYEILNFSPTCNFIISNSYFIVT